MRTSLDAKSDFLSGNEALAQGAYEEGLEVAASYPGTPATEILEYLSGFAQIDSQWSVNEKIAFEVALSSAIAGKRSLYASKHVGLNVAMDPLMTSSYTGINAGFIVVTCDDPGLHSSQNEQDNRLIARMAKIPLLEPASPSEAKAFVKEAFEISECFDTPVILRLTTRISHTKENIILGRRKESGRKDFKINAAKYVMVPANAYKRHIELEKRLTRLKAYAQSCPLNRIELKNKKIGFITSGVSYLYVKEMYPDASCLKLGFTFPFPDGKARRFAKSVKELVVVEELEPFLEEQLAIAGIKCRSKHPSFRIGELKPEYIPYIVKGKKKPEEERNARRPVLCPGCPHRLVFATLKKLKVVVTGDIGCYTLGAAPPLSSLHTCLCMGSGITFFEGFRRTIKEKVVGVIGDSTFVHSGIPGLINLSYNQTKGLVIILDNATTAMTGAQPHPATGVTIKQEVTKKLILEDVCVACGADHVDVVDPYNIKGLEELIKKRLGEDALSVVIARHPCKLLKREKSAPTLYLEEKCKKCYLCMAIDCPALRKNDDGSISIDAELCAACRLCVSVCNPKALQRK
ncbi:MAG: thiamine pyrophosphate-dependent enzyme [Candidatus Omnitrophica bacterium]|nr:thiamine pyrophosphate-dependent enzyme [Candidatus Omnitrophota bacterium]MDD5237496.1 thiamine pyrophosphate-dependent enzyme [Candidatus Omnitrophota bacterium]